MPGKQYEERSTEEIRAINDVDIAEKAEEQKAKNKYKVPFIVLCISFVILLSAISINYVKDSMLINGQLPDKDEFLSVVGEMNTVKFNYKGSDLSVENTEGILELLNSDSWIKTDDTPTDPQPECTMKISSDRQIEFYEDIVVIRKGELSRSYSVTSGVTDSICAYLEDNTYISVEDMESLLSLSESLTLSINGISCVASNGQSVANALNTSTWTETDKADISEEIFLSISDPRGLSIEIYEVAKLAVVSYKGNTRCYTVGELVPASVALAAKAVFDAEAVKIGSSMKEIDSLIVISDGQSYRTATSSAWISSIAFDTWTRRYKDPAAIPDNADITIFDNISFTLKIYEDLLIAEYDNAYYNIPDTVVSSIKNFLSVSTSEEDDTEVTVFTVSDFISEMMKNTYLNSEFSGKTSKTSVSANLVSALGINSWTALESAVSLNSYDVVFKSENFSPSAGVAISINSTRNTARLEWKGLSQFYRMDTDVSNVTKYIQNNVYTELWQISATELGTLQKAAESVETVIVNSNSEKNYLNSESIGVSEIIKIAASLDLTPSDVKQEAKGPAKIEMTFRTNTNKFLMTLYETSAGQLAVSVSGTLSDIGKRIDRCFIADGDDYDSFLSDLNGVVEKSYDIVAGMFVESIRSANTKTLNDLTGKVYDYSSITKVKYNDITSEKTETMGEYLIKLDVADPVDGPFDEGVNTYILVIGSVDGGANLKVRAFTNAEEYAASKVDHGAASFALEFASWYVSENPYFDSFDGAASRKSAVEFLMHMALHEGLNIIDPETPTIMFFTAETIKSMALKYFNVENFNGEDTSVYNAETGMYEYASSAILMDYKRIVEFSENTETGEYVVTVKWYDDPMYLYENKTVYYLLDKDSKGVYRILSATAEAPVLTPEVLPEENEPAEEQDPAEEQTPTGEQEPGTEGETPTENADPQPSEPENTEDNEPSAENAEGEESEE